MPLEMRALELLTHLYCSASITGEKTEVYSKGLGVQGDPRPTAWLQSWRAWQCTDNSLELGGSRSITKVSSGALFGMNLDSLSALPPTPGDHLWRRPMTPRSVNTAHPVQSPASAQAVPTAGCLSGVSTCPFLGELPP